MAHLPPEQLEHVPDPAARKRARKRAGERKPYQPNRGFWIAARRAGDDLAADPVHRAVLRDAGDRRGQAGPADGVAGRGCNPPWQWSSANLSNVWRDLFGSGAFVGVIAWRTIWYVVVASLLSLVIAYPAAYFVARFAGRRKGFFLVLLIAPFWISYMMRMLAWIDLLQTNGYVNKVLSFVGLGSPVTGWAATGTRSFSGWSTATSRT